MFTQLIKTLITLVIIIGLGLAILFLQKNNSFAPEDTFPSLAPSPFPSTPPTPTENRTSSSIKEFKITARRFEFEPREIRVKKDDQLRLKITSVDTTHGFSIEEFKINETVVPQKETVVEFTADTVGEFPFACSVFCGSGHGGMKGILIVEE